MAKHIEGKSVEIAFNECFSLLDKIYKVCFKGENVKALKTIISSESGEMRENLEDVRLAMVTGTYDLALMKIPIIMYKLKGSSSHKWHKIENLRDFFRSVRERPVFSSCKSGKEISFLLDLLNEFRFAENQIRGVKHQLIDEMRTKILEFNPAIDHLTDLVTDVSMLKILSSSVDQI